MTQKTFKKYFAGLTRDTFFLALVSLFADISTEMLYPVLPIFLTQNLKAGGSIVGLVEGIALATQNIIQGFSGTLSDKLHRRKAIALVGYSLGALSKPLIGLSTIWTQVLGARFLDRLGTGIRSAPRDALIASSTDEKNRGKAFGLEGIGDNLGAFIGPIITILILFSFHLDIRHIFYLSIIPGLLAVSMMIFVKEKKIESVSGKVKLTLKNFSPAYWRYLAITAVFGLGAFSNTFFILQTRSIGIPLQTTILIYAFFNLVAALVSYPSGFLSDKFGRRNVLLGGFIIFLITCLGFAITKNFLLIALLFIFYGSFQGIFRAVGKAFATDLTPSGLRASGVGWYSTTVGLSALVASLVAGQLWDRLGHESVFFFGAAFALLGILFLLTTPAALFHSKTSPTQH